MSFVRVALDVPLPILFEYRATAVTRDDIGRRVLVPFGRKIAVGVIIELTDTTDLATHRVRRILSVQRDVPPLPEDVLQLLRFCSDYYHHPLGAVILNALPTRLRRRQTIKPVVSARYLLTAAGRNIDSATLPARAKIKRALLGMLQIADGGVDEAHLHAVAPRARAAVKTMVEFGWIERVQSPHVARRAAADTPTSTADRILTDEQHTAIASLRAGGDGFTPWLLFGVTGSGKTEVYLQRTADVLAQDKQVLLLVPEINLTPQLETRLRERFPATNIVSLHSGLNESERLHGWLAAQSGHARIVLGTRLAVFTPLPQLGLIVVDEEHDASFKQMEGLRYSARDLALVRAKQRAVPIILGSATPALETFHQALNGRYRLLTLAQRVNAMPPPDIEFVDTRQSPLMAGLSQDLLKAIGETMRRGEQSLVFINRRGYAPVLICRSCGWTADCHRCSAKLVLHAMDRRLHCHHCGHRELIHAACPQCGNQDLLPLGQGTQRVETTLARAFPTARILRVDRDSTRRKHAWRTMHSQIRAREVDILVGTQILAKGHDFPQLNVVGVLNADSSLYSTDFRAGERLFARLTQVAGRAGRGALRGRVLIQTEFPMHPLYQALRRHDYPSYARDLLAERKQAGFPPFVHQAALRAEATRLDDALSFLAHASRLATDIDSAVTLYDPVPANLVRLAGLERAHLTVQARSRTALQTFLRVWRQRLDTTATRNVRWALDVDPLEL